MAKTGTKAPRWDLGDLYDGISDPGLERDMKNTSSRAARFERKYRGKIKSPSLTPRELLEAVRELESISERIGKMLSFAHLLFAADTRSPETGAFRASAQEKATEFQRRLIFFYVEWVSVPQKRAKKLLDHPALSRYAHFLRQERQYRNHTLTEAEEKILQEKSNTGRRAFSRLFDETVNSIEFRVRTDGKTEKLSQSRTLALLYDPDRGKRKAAARGLTRGLVENSRVLAYVFNTLVNDHSIDDRLRSYENPMSSRHLDNEIPHETVETLLEACERNFETARRYYRLKRKLLGYRRFRDYDRYAPLGGKRGNVPWSRAREIVLDSFGEFSPRMRKTASMFFERNWIDAELRDGKRGGAFSHGTVPGAHPYVLMNYTGKPRDVMVLAHELGHGVHQYLSRGKGYFQAHTPLTTAETASVFAEMLVFHRLKDSERNRRRRLVLVAEKVEDILATVFRQAVLTRFEQSLHRERREKGELSTGTINALWTEANRDMFADSVELTDDYAWWWLYIPHFIHSPFYCYAYSFGELLVLALYGIYAERGKSFVPDYLSLLSSGGSEPPEKLVSRVGVDINDPGFWQSGLDMIAAMVDEVEELAAAL